MAFKLPVLTDELDCEPIGYPGLVVSLRLNPGYEDHEFPWEGIEDEAKRDKERARVLEAEPWLSEFYHTLARMVDLVVFPAGMNDSDTGIPELWEIPDSKALYDLMFTPGFDQNIIIWTTGQYTERNQERLKAEVKN